MSHGIVVDPNHCDECRDWVAATTRRDSAAVAWLNWRACLAIIDAPGPDTPEKLEVVRALPDLTAALHGAIDARVAAEYQVEEGGA